MLLKLRNNSSLKSWGYLNSIKVALSNSSFMWFKLLEGSVDSLHLGTDYLDL